MLDPAWPKPLPNNWIIGDVGGISRSTRTTTSGSTTGRGRSLPPTAGAQGAAGKDAQGPADQRASDIRGRTGSSRVLRAGAVGARVRQGGQPDAGVGRPGDPGFLEKKCRAQDGCYWPAREHGIFVDHNDFVYISGNGQVAEGLHGEFPWAANFGTRLADPEVHARRHVRLSDRHAGHEEAEQQRHQRRDQRHAAAVSGRGHERDPKTNILYVADGYGNRRVLIVDAATGKYIGHFGAYGQNPVVGENGGDPIGEGGGLGRRTSGRAQMKPTFFRSPLHCAKLANDGLLYVCDRGNNRIQVFKASEVGKPCANPNGEAGKCGFVGEVSWRPQTAGGTSGPWPSRPIAEQTCLYVADLTNYTIYVRQPRRTSRS